MRRGLFYGWAVVAGAFFGYAISAGLMHSYAVSLLAYLGEFGWGRAETSVAYSVSQLVMGISAPLVGTLVGRLGTRALVVAGASLLVIGLAASASVSALWQVIALYGFVMTLGANGLGLVVSVPLLSRCFVRRRGLAISIVQSANGFGRAASAPLVQLLISSIGWRRSYLALSGVMAAAVVPIVRAFPTREPEPADREGGDRRPPVAPPAHRWTVGEAMRTAHFPPPAPSRSTWASTSSTRPASSAWGACSRSSGPSAPGRSPTTSGARSRRSSPTCSRSSA